MKTRNVLKIALVGILLTAFVAPNAMAQTTYQYAMSSQVTSGGAASWLLNIDETINVVPNQVLGYGYQNTFNNNYPGQPCYIYRLSSTDPVSGLNPSLSSYNFNNYLLSSGSYYDVAKDKVTVSSSASGQYVMSTSHYYYPKNKPGTVWYPSTGAVKTFTV